MPTSSSSSSSSVSSTSSKSSKSSSAMSYDTRNARKGIAPQSPVRERGSSEDDSSSEPSSFSDEEKERRNKKMTKKPETSKGARKSKAVKRKKSETSEDEAYEEFKHLFETKAEYFECMNKTEKEKEQIIYEKMERYEQMKERERIEATLAARARGEELANSSNALMESENKKKERGRPPKKQAPKKPASDDSDSEMDAEFHQPTDIARKKEQKTAMANLAQKRKEKERKEEKKKASLSVDAVFGKDESDSSSSDDDSSSTTSSSSSSSSSLSDDAPVVEESRPVESLEELRKAQVSRKLLRVLVFTPQLADVITGGYVLIRSVEMENSHNEFHIWKIVDVIEGSRPYRLDDVKTSKVLKCKWANQEKTIQLTYVSNQYFTQDQFDEFKLVNNQDLPSIEFLNQKEVIIQKNKTPQYTKEVVDHIVREKKKFGLSHTNFALAKSELISKRTAHEANNERELAAKVQKQIDDLDKTASELEKKRLGDIAHVNMINQRNRQQQSNKFFGQHKKLMTAETEEENPFTRKKERMRVVCGTSKTAEFSKSDATVKTETVTTVVVRKEEPEAAPVVKKEEPVAPVKALTLAEKIKLAQSGQPKKKEPVDVFNLHNTIDFDFGFELPLTPKNAGKSSTSRKSAYY